MKSVFKIASFPYQIIFSWVFCHRWKHSSFRWHPAASPSHHQIHATTVICVGPLAALHTVGGSGVRAVAHLTLYTGAPSHLRDREWPAMDSVFPRTVGFLVAKICSGSNFYSRQLEIEHTPMAKPAFCLMCVGAIYPAKERLKAREQEKERMASYRRKHFGKQ